MARRQACFSPTTGLILIAIIFPALAYTPPSIPAMQWGEGFSDWSLGNVKTAFGAVGDGVHDDTKAVQAALSELTSTGQGNGGNHTVYFPPGTYLITSTLILNRTGGSLVIGCGSLTTLLWGGASGNATAATRLFWSDGNTRTQFEGLSFDGANTCGVGLDHDSHTIYESRVVHRSLAFTRFIVAGIRVGHDQYSDGGVASAEMTYENCLFTKNAAGVQYGAWNDYDNYFTGCEFGENGYGVQAFAGNMYVTESRFVANNISDGTITAHANSYRWVVSANSTAFLTTLPGNGGGSPTKLQGVVVVGWGVANASSAAVIMGPRGPLQVIDSLFIEPLFPGSPALHFGGSGHGADEALVLSNASASPGPLLDPNTGSNITHTIIAGPGDPVLRARLPFLSPATQFISDAWVAPGVTFDAVTQFGADPSGRNRSSASLQSCADAASVAGNGAVCYLRSGVYLLNETLRACGSNWTLQGSGSGFTTVLRWDPTANSSIPAVTLAIGPGAGCSMSTNLSITRLNLFSSLGAWPSGQVDLAVSRTQLLPQSPTCFKGLPASCRPTILLSKFVQSDAPLRLRLDALYFQSAGGAIVCGLKAGDVLHGPLWDGNLVIQDSSDAIVMPSFFSPESAGLTVARSSTATAAGAAYSGVLGAACLVTSASVYDIWLFNSSSFAAADWYTETSHGAVYLEGDGVSSPGTVALSSAKMNTNAPTWGALVSNNYAGTVLLTGAVASYAPFNVTLSGTAKIDVAIVGYSLWENASEVFNSNSAAKVHRAANIIVSDGFDCDTVFADTAAIVAAGYDALRALGITHLGLNFPGVASAL